jgi:hypothetical protein
MIVTDAICFMKTRGDPRLADVAPVDREAMLDGQAEPPPDRNPSCVAAEESGRRLARAVLESMDAIKQDAVVYPSWNSPPSLIGALNSPHDKSADERQSLKTKPISRGTESSNPVPSSGESSERLGSFGVIGDGDLSILTLVRATPRPAATGEAGGLIRCHRDLGVEAMKVVSTGETWSGSGLAHSPA